MWKLTQLSSLQETKSLVSHPLRKNPQSLVGQKEKVNNIQNNQNQKVRQSKGSVFYFLSNFYKRIRSSSPLENKLPRAIYKEDYKTKYLRLFTIFPNLITKESYNWWVTRRKWGFRHKKFEAKYPNVSVTNIGKLQEKFRCTV